MPGMEEQVKQTSDWKCPKCGETDVELMSTNGGRWCKPCDAIGTDKSDRLKRAASLRLGISPAKDPNQKTPCWGHLSKPEKRAELKTQRRIVVTPPSPPAPITPRLSKQNRKVIIDNPNPEVELLVLRNRNQKRTRPFILVAEKFEHMIYFAYDEAEPGETKVGVSRDTTTRLAKIGDPFIKKWPTIHIHREIPIGLMSKGDALKYETLVHDQLVNWRIYHYDAVEWFDITPARAYNKIVKWMEIVEWVKSQ